MKLIRKPFKGTTHYEWQIAMFVFQIRHKKEHNCGIIIPLPFFHVWRDRYWR